MTACGDGRPAPPAMNRRQEVAGGSAWMSDRGAEPLPATVGVFLSGGEEHLRLEVTAGPLDGRNVGATALLTRPALQELIETLVLARERWDRARREVE